MSNIIEEFDDEEIMDFIQSRGGSKLEAFKRECQELHKEMDFVAASIITKERESESYLTELNYTRDQVSGTRRNIDELLSSQEAASETIDATINRRNDLLDREKKNRDEISEFTGYFNDLKAALSIGADWTTEQLEQKQTLEKEKDFVTSKYESQMAEVNGVRGDVDRIYQLIQKLEEENNALDSEATQAAAKVKDSYKEAREQTKKKEELEAKMFEIRATIVKCEQESSEKTKLFRAEERALEKLNGSLKDSKDQLEQYIKDYNQLYHVLQDVTAELEKQKTLNRKLEEENEERQTYLRDKTEGLEGLSQEIDKLTQLRDAALKKRSEVEEEKSNLDEKRDSLLKSVQMLRDVDSMSMRKDIESQERQLSSLRQELDVMKKKQFGSERGAKSVSDLIQVHVNGKRNLTMELRVLEEDFKVQKEQIRLLLSEKDRFEHDAEISNQQYYTALEELKLQELQLQELQKKIHEDQAKLKHKQNLYEAVRSDRNLYSKQLIDSQEEINGLRRQFRSMSHHIEQLKEEISAKDRAIVKEHFMHHSVDKERELLKNELTKVKKQVQSSESIIENQRVEILKLNRIVDEADQERNRQVNEVSAVIAERNLLTAQVVKRNSELAALYDRIKLQRSNLRLGEKKYLGVIESIAHWQSQLRMLVTNNNDTMTKLSSADELRRKIIQVEKDILTEQRRSRALLDELDRPMNVHRWRILESSDPKRFEKITQIQRLQRLLVEKSDDDVRYDLMIQEKEKVYVELKNLIARHPGPEVEEQILLYQQTLKDKMKQSVSMEEELSMYRQQVQTFKEEILEGDSQLANLKKKWIKTKRIESKKI